MLRGYGRPYLRVASYFMLRIIQFLPLTALRTVELEEIERAARLGPPIAGRIEEE